LQLQSQLQRRQFTHLLREREILEGGSKALNFIISASTDVGIKKDTNQDCLFVRTLKTNQGRMVFAVLCDGMGGLAKGEVASASLINAFTEWMNTALPALAQSGIEDSTIRAQWDGIVTRMNEKIMNYGKQNSVNLGTTVVTLLLTDKRYCIMNVGDSRAYEIAGSLNKITNDQTVVAKEVSLGNMTQEDADKDPRRNVLLQCVGASNEVLPDFFFGDTKQNAVYMLCSDGFRHVITPEELYTAFDPNQMSDVAVMKERADQLIELNKRRNEEDNISVITIRTF
jgi:serine/threonine protein phosphatase PrpC